MSACFAQRRKCKNLRAHSTIPLILGQQISPIELMEGPLNKGSPHQSSIRLKTPQILSKKFFFFVGVMSLQRTNDQIIAVFFRHPTVSPWHIPDFFDRRAWLNQFLSTKASQVVDDRNTILHLPQFELLVVLLKKRQNQLRLLSMNTNMWERSFDVHYHIARQLIGKRR